MLLGPAPNAAALVGRILVALLFSAGLLAALHFGLGPRGRRWVVALVTFAAGLFFGLEYFWPAHGKPSQNFLTPWLEPVTLTLAVIGAFTVGLGIYSLCQVHGRNIARRRPGWHNSAAFFAAMMAMLVFGLWDHYISKAAVRVTTAREERIGSTLGQSRPSGTVCAEGASVPGAVTVVNEEPCVPLRAVAEQVGGRVNWAPDRKEAQVRLGGHDLRVRVGSERASADGKALSMPVSSWLERDRTMVAARSLAEALGLEVHYESGVVHYFLPPEAVGSQWARNVYEVLFNGLFSPLQAATFSLLAFYIASAAYRAFRIRTLEAGLMMAAAFIVMLGQVPVGRWLTSGLPETGWQASLRLEVLGEWVMAWLNTPAQRAITFGILVGALAMSLRIWLSLERGTFFSEQS